MLDLLLLKIDFRPPFNRSEKIKQKSVLAWTCAPFNKVTKLISPLWLWHVPDIGVGTGLINAFPSHAVPGFEANSNKDESWGCVCVSARRREDKLPGSKRRNKSPMAEGQEEDPWPYICPCVPPSPLLCKQPSGAGEGSSHWRNVWYGCSGRGRGCGAVG